MDQTHTPASLVADVLALRSGGRMDEAIALLRQRVEYMPADATAWGWLADTLAGANRPDLAYDAWTRTLAIEPRSPRALCGRAQALAALGRPSEARGDFAAALEIEPNNFAARYGLALLAFQAGDLGAAEGHIDHLGEAQRLQPAAAWLSAKVALSSGRLQAASATIDGVLAGSRLDPAARADASLLKAEILDRLGQAGPAFAAAREAKAIQRRLFAARAAQHESEITKLERLTAWFRVADPAPWRQPANVAPGEAEAHVFLLGFPRSGTTVLEQALAGHSRIVALEEAPTLAEHYQAFLTTAEGLNRLARLGSADATAWRNRYWAAVRAHGIEPGGRMFLDKAPAGTLNLPIIAKLFPAARILFAVRDPRDVALSCHMNAFQMNALTYAFTDLAETARCYAACMTLAETYRAKLPLNLMEVRHEGLVADFDQHLQAITAFIGVSFEAAMSDIAATASRRSVRTPSAAQVRGGLTDGRLQHWRAYEAELAPIMQILAPWVARFGYPAL